MAISKKKKFALFFLSIFIGKSCMSSEWVHQASLPSAYIFSPPILQSELATVYYSGDYTASTGEQFHCKTPFLVLNSDYVTSCNFSEIKPLKGEMLKSFPNGYPMGAFSLVTSIFFDWGHRVYNHLFDVSVINPNGSDTSVARYSLDASLFNIAQKPDRDIFLKAYNRVIASSDNDLVLYGFSRGSGTIFTFMTNEYLSHKTKKVKAVVLGGCFDSIRNALNNRSKLILGTGSSGTLYWLLEKTFPSFGYNREEPIDFADKFPHDVPVLLVTSKWDMTVPYLSTVALYEKLKESGHPDVHLLVLDKALHTTHFLNSKKDRKKYLSVVHAFYKKYGLSYIAEYAKEGEQLLAQC